MWSFSRVASSVSDQPKCSRMRSVGPAERLEQHGDRLAALAVDADADGRALVDVELEPGAAARDDLDAVDVDVGGLVQRAVEVDARRADELADDDALGAVDDEGALAGHHREVAHEHRLALDLAGRVVGELRGDEQRRRVGHVLVLALLDGRLDVLEARVGEGQAHRAGEVLDRGDLVEDLVETGLGDVSCRRRLDPSPPGCRCRPASRTTRSAARGGSAPPAARGSWRRRSGGVSPGSRIPCSFYGTWSYRSGRLPRCVLPRTNVRPAGLPSGITKWARHGPQGSQKAAQQTSVATVGTTSKASPSGGPEPTTPAAPLPSGGYRGPIAGAWKLCLARGSPSSGCGHPRGGSAPICVYSGYLPRRSSVYA